MITEAQKKAKEKYRQKRKSILLEFFPPEHDLYDYLQKQRTKATYIKNLIREDMKKSEQ